jgi:hypothetical protein
MSANDPIAELMEDHRLIEKVLDALDRLAAAFNDGQDPRVDPQLRARYRAFASSL